MKLETGMYIRTDEGIRKILNEYEEGDYVNGEKVGYIDDCKGAMKQFYYDYENPNEDVGHWEEEIKSIVTKERVKQMSYKVGD